MDEKHPASTPERTQPIITNFTKRKKEHEAVLKED